MKKAFRQIKKFPNWIYIPIAIFLKIWYLTLRKSMTGSYNPDKQAILNIWHNRILFCAFPFSKEYLKRTNAIISPSRDGQYIADVLAALGLQSVRGSSSKNGAKALIASIKALRSGLNVSLTPDGPRGPKYCVHPGTVALASKTGVPILPYALNCSNYWELKSWDNFQIPKPFSKLEFHLAEPIHVPEKLSDEQVKEYCEKVRVALMAVTTD